MQSLKYYAIERRGYSILSRAPADPCRILAIWPRLCRHFRRFPDLRWQASRSGYSYGSPWMVSLNIVGLTWLTLVHEYSHCLAGCRNGRWHGPHHERAVARVAAYVTRKGWHLRRRARPKRQPPRNKKTRKARRASSAVRQPTDRRHR